jgi:hypothetical protein
MLLYVSGSYGDECTIDESLGSSPISFASAESEKKVKNTTGSSCSNSALD